MFFGLTGRLYFLTLADLGFRVRICLLVVWFWERLLRTRVGTFFRFGIFRGAREAAQAKITHRNMVPSCVLQFLQIKFGFPRL